MAMFLYKAADRIRKRTDLNVQCGLPQIRSAPEDYLYVDHAYFRRGFENQYLRITRGWVHQIDVIERPIDRFQTLGITIEPWRKTGTPIVIIPPSGHQVTAFDVGDWAAKTVEEVKKYTDRRIIVKTDKATALRPFLNDAWALVTWSSVAAVESAIFGVPVFSTDKCPSWAINAGTIDKIETPEYKERLAWACGLAYCTWHVSELDRISYNKYHHARSHDM